MGHVPACQHSVYFVRLTNIPQILRTRYNREKYMQFIEKLDEHLQLGSLLYLDTEIRPQATEPLFTPFLRDALKADDWDLFQTLKNRYNNPLFFHPQPNNPYWHDSDAATSSRVTYQQQVEYAAEEKDYDAEDNTYTADVNKNKLMSERDILEIRTRIEQFYTEVVILHSSNILREIKRSEEFKQKFIDYVKNHGKFSFRLVKFLFDNPHEELWNIVKDITRCGDKLTIGEKFAKDSFTIFTRLARGYHRTPFSRTAQYGHFENYEVFVKFLDFFKPQTLLETEQWCKFGIEYLKGKNSKCVSLFKKFPNIILKNTHDINSVVSHDKFAEIFGLD
jgi:hypothetical protein